MSKKQKLMASCDVDRFQRILSIVLIRFFGINDRGQSVDVDDEVSAYDLCKFDKMATYYTRKVNSRQLGYSSFISLLNDSHTHHCSNVSTLYHEPIDLDVPDATALRFAQEVNTVTAYCSAYNAIYDCFTSEVHEFKTMANSMSKYFDIIAILELLGTISSDLTTLRSQSPMIYKFRIAAEMLRTLTCKSEADLQRIKHSYILITDMATSMGVPECILTDVVGSRAATI